MTLRHLRIFTAVCSAGGVTAAAQQLYLSQPAVSLAIGELEQEYGVPLFDRMGRKLYLTEAGRKLLAYASHLVTLWDEMEAEVRDWAQEGDLRLGSSVTIGSDLLPRLLLAYRTGYPRARVQVFIENSESVERRVLQGEIDLGLVEGVPQSEYLIRHPFARDELVLLCGPEHPLAARESIGLKELQDQSFLMRERGSAGRDIWESILKAQDILLTPLWESISTQAILRGVEAGLGITVLPERMAKQALEEGRVHRVCVEGVSLQRDLSVIYHRNKYLTPAAQTFLRQLFAIGEDRQSGA